MRAVDPDLDGRGSFLLAAALREAAEGLPEGCRALLVGQPRVAAVAVRLSHLHCPFLWETADTGQIRALLGAHLEPVLSAFGRPATPGHPTRRTVPRWLAWWRGRMRSKPISAAFWCRQPDVPGVYLARCRPRTGQVAHLDA